MKFIKQIISFSFIISCIILTGCSNEASKAYASDNIYSIEEFFNLFHITEDGTLLWVDDYEKRILYDEDGKEYLEVQADDYTVSVLVTNNGLTPKRIEYDGGTITGNVTSKWLDRLEASGIDYKSYLNVEEEQYITVKDVLKCYSVININKDNFWNYFNYKEINKKEEITGLEDETRQIFKNKKTKVLDYIGSKDIITDFSSQITFSGSYSYVMSLKIFDGEGKLTSEQDDYYNNSENYYRAFDVNDITEIYFPNTLEYWTYRELDGSLSKYSTVGEIELTDATGKILLFENKIPEEAWNTTKNEEKYLAIKLDDGSVVRCFEKFGFINPTDFSLQERNFYESFSSTVTLQTQIDSTLSKIVSNCQNYSAYDGLTDDEIIEKYEKEYKFSFGNLKYLGNYSINDF